MRKGGRRTGGGRIRRIARRWWPDRNPLRRRSDRAEALIGAGLMVAFLAAAPVLGVAAGQWAHDVAQRTAAAERASAHPVAATVLQTAPPPVIEPRALSATAEEPARWITPRGAVHVGQLLVPGGTLAGTVLRVWTDAQGRLTDAPLLPSQVAEQAAVVGLLTPAAFALVLAGCWLLVRLVLNVRRMAWWEAQWSATGPTWTRRTR